MATDLTGRLVLKFLHMHGGESTITELGSTLDSNTDTIEPMVRSLAAAKLVCRGAGDHLELSDAGKVWCGKEFKSDIGGVTTPADVKSSASSEGSNTIKQTDSAPINIEKTQVQRKINRMNGVQVVNVSRRSEQTSSSPTAKSTLSLNFQPVIQKFEPKLAETSVEEDHDRVSSDHVPNRDPGFPDAAVQRAVDTDQNGFVTHINGRRIF